MTTKTNTKSCEIIKLRQAAKQDSNRDDLPIFQGYPYISNILNKYGSLHLKQGTVFTGKYLQILDTKQAITFVNMIHSNGKIRYRKHDYYIPMLKKYILTKLHRGLHAMKYAKNINDVVHITSSWGSGADGAFRGDSDMPNINTYARPILKTKSKRNDIYKAKELMTYAQYDWLEITSTTCNWETLYIMNNNYDYMNHLSANELLKLIK